jgi:hypothetical protein
MHKLVTWERTLVAFNVLGVAVESNAQAHGGILFTFQYPAYFHNIINISIKTLHFSFVNFEFCTLQITQIGDGYIDDMCK